MIDKKDHSKKMIRLDDIPKNRMFSTPEDYFDKLPGIIRSKTTETAREQGFVFNLPVFYRLAVPALAILLVVFYFALRPTGSNYDVPALLAEVSTAELIAYLDESDITTDELLSLVNIEDIAVDTMFEEDIQLLDDNELNQILDEYEDFELIEFENEI
jgi:hypothetical protein